MKFELPGGRIIEGINYTEIVQQMADEKMSTPRSLSSYRRAVARRIYAVHPDTVINFSTNRKFVESLVAVNQLVRK